MLVTTRDRLVRPAKQRELAAALNAHVTEIDADHDLPLTRSADYARLTRLAVDTITATAFANDPSITSAAAPPDRTA
jgi:hypothetical protein